MNILQAEEGHLQRGKPVGPLLGVGEYFLFAHSPVIPTPIYRNMINLLDFRFIFHSRVKRVYTVTLREPPPPVALSLVRPLLTAPPPLLCAQPQFCLPRPRRLARCGRGIAALLHAAARVRLVAPV